MNDFRTNLPLRWFQNEAKIGQKIEEPTWKPLDTLAINRLEVVLSSMD